MQLLLQSLLILLPFLAVSSALVVAVKEHLEGVAEAAVDQAHAVEDHQLGEEGDVLGRALYGGACRAVSAVIVIV